MFANKAEKIPFVYSDELGCCCFATPGIPGILEGVQSLTFIGWRSRLPQCSERDFLLSLLSSLLRKVVTGPQAECQRAHTDAFLNYEREYSTNEHFLLCLTLFFVIAPTIIGQTIPDSVPTTFEMPIKILAYLGAISKWLTLKPEIHTEDVTQRIPNLAEAGDYRTSPTTLTNLLKRHQVQTMCLTTIFDNLAQGYNENRKRYDLLSNT